MNLKLQVTNYCYVLAVRQKLHVLILPSIQTTIENIILGWLLTF